MPSESTATSCGTARRLGSSYSTATYWVASPWSRFLGRRVLEWTSSKASSRRTCVTSRTRGCCRRSWSGSTPRCPLTAMSTRIFAGADRAIYRFNLGLYLIKLGLKGTKNYSLIDLVLTIIPPRVDPERQQDAENYCNSLCGKTLPWDILGIRHGLDYTILDVRFGSLAALHSDIT